MVLAGTFGWSPRGKVAPPASPGVHSTDGGSGEPPKP
jgi:hypothetical protein